MQELYDDKNRQVIPRWRKFTETRRGGELRPLSAGTTSPIRDDPSFTEKLGAWQNGRTTAFAIELLESAVVLGREQEARDAAEFVMANATPEIPGAVGLARRILGKDSGGLSSFESGRTGAFDIEGTKHRIQRLRKQLQDETSNAFMWVDLARAYENLGSTEKATRAIRIAMEVAPMNRFVLRAASRHFVHKEDLETAHRVLRKSPLVERDPWILAAEIAVAAAAGKQSRHIKLAKQFIEDRRFSSFDMSELASAVGTVELSSSALKGRKILRVSLEEPTENATAQAAWVGRQFKMEVDEEKMTKSIDMSPEASAYAYFRAENWSNALEQSRYWWQDQPFSRRPTVFGSYVAHVIGDNKQCAEMSEDGLIANRGDFTLLNNWALSLARMGNVPQAVKVFNKIDMSKMNADERFIWRATHGALCFRNDDPVQGHIEYALAINYFKGRTVQQYAGAVLNYSLEQLEIATPEEAARIKESANRIFGEAKEPDVKTLLRRVMNYTR